MGINDTTAPAGTFLYFIPENFADASAEIETGEVGTVDAGLSAWTTHLVYVKHDRYGHTFIRRDRTFLSRLAAETVMTALRRTEVPARALAA